MQPLDATSGELDPDLATVVIPARNEEDFIGPCLDSVLEQDYRNLEVLVVDGMSSDGTAARVADYAARDPRVRLLRNPLRIVPTGLNVAARSASGAWFVRIDAHAKVPPDYVRLAVDRLKTGRWGGVGGRKDGSGVNAVGDAIAAAMGSRFGVGDSVYHYGTRVQTVDHIPFGAYRTELIRRLGGWNETFVVNQDFEFDYRIRRAGYDLLFDPALRIEWHSRQTIRDLFRQYHRYGKGKFRVMRAHPESVRPRHAAAPALVLLLAVAAAAATRRPRTAAALVAPYATAVATASAVTARRLDDGKARAAVPAAFAAMHVGWGLGFWDAATRALVGRVRAAGGGDAAAVGTVPTAQRPHPVAAPAPPATPVPSPFDV